LTTEIIDVQHQAIVTQIKRWLELTVIGLNFCPFAKKEFERQSIRYAFDSSNTQKEALNTLIEELALMDGESKIETTLLIYDKAYFNYDDYLDWLEIASSFIEHSAYRGIFQIASFHPDYCFEGEPTDDPANFTNRSPMPMIHILRETSLERVLKNFSQPELIPQKNIDKARELGYTYLQNLLLSAQR
jgi:uncharacterized protein